MRPIGDRAVTVSDRDIADFYTEMSPYRYGDIETALEKFAEVELSSEVLAEKIKELVTLIQIVEHDKQMGYITEETAKEKLNQYREIFWK